MDLAPKPVPPPKGDAAAVSAPKPGPGIPSKRPFTISGSLAPPFNVSAKTLVLLMLVLPLKFGLPKMPRPPPGPPNALPPNGLTETALALVPNPESEELPHLLLEVPPTSPPPTSHPLLFRMRVSSAVGPSPPRLGSSAVRPCATGGPTSGGTSTSRPVERPPRPSTSAPPLLPLRPPQPRSAWAQAQVLRCAAGCLRLLPRSLEFDALLLSHALGLLQQVERPRP